jgi:hypothetical protein
MVKAVSLLRERAQEAAGQPLATEESDEPDHSDINPNDDEGEEVDHDMGYAVNVDCGDLLYRRLGCLVHTLQLLVKEAYNSGEYKEVLQKARALVSKIRKSSVTVQKIVEKCGKTVINDNSTRWNSTYLMAQRLLEIKQSLNMTLDELKIDGLLSSEWCALEEIVALLEPFRVQTDVLQTDGSSLSNVIPSLLELECHLDQFPEQFPSSSTLTSSMKEHLRNRFSNLLDPNDVDFNPLPAAACLLDPTCAPVILGFETSELREKAKKYILSQVIEIKTLMSVHY